MPVVLSASRLSAAHTGSGCFEEEKNSLPFLLKRRDSYLELFLPLPFFSLSLPLLIVISVYGRE